MPKNFTINAAHIYTKYEENIPPTDQLNKICKCLIIDIMSDPCVCSVIIETRTREEKALLRKAYSPFLAWIDPSFKLIKLIKKTPDYKIPNKWTWHRFDQIICSPDVMTSPALSVMLFLHDTEPLSSKRFQQHFASTPWKLHHRVELVNIHSPSLALADQKFYQAEFDTPLWAVCPVEQGNEHLRFNIFVRNFPAMVEFYRVITGVEMETTKDNFCWFQLYSQPGVKIRLGLKHHKSINPIPSQSFGLRFKINNINNIRDVIGTKFRLTAPGCFVVADPDGNTVYLDSGLSHLSILTAFQPSLLQPTKKVFNGLYEKDAKFNKKTSESSDSGHFSDSETGVSEYKLFRQNVKSNYSVLTATFDQSFDVSKKRNSQIFSTHTSNVQNLPPRQPDLNVEEKLLQKNKTPIIVSVIEKFKSQLQMPGQVTGVKTCEYTKAEKVESNKSQTILHQEHISGIQETCAMLHGKTLGNVSSSCDLKKNASYPLKSFQYFSHASPLESVEETDDGFYDQTLSHGVKSVLSFWLKRRNDKDLAFSDCNEIRLNSFAGKNSSQNNISVDGTTETDIAEVSNEIFV